jgi:hypothetical protein
MATRKSLNTKYALLATDIFASAASATYSEVFEDTIGGQSPMVNLVKTVAFSDVAATLVLQGSLDGTNWVDLHTLDSDVVHTAGTIAYAPDLSAKQAPYYRFKFNGGNLAAGTAGRMYLQVAFRYQP